MTGGVTENRALGGAVGLTLAACLAITSACNAGSANAAPPDLGEDSGGSGGEASGGSGGGSGGDGGSGGATSSRGSGGDEGTSNNSGGGEVGSGGSNQANNTGSGASGGSDPTGSGGTGGGESGGAPGTTGSGGSTTTSPTTSGSGGTGGEPACLEPATATGAVALTPTDGWVDCSSNTVGVEGAFFTFSDDGGSSISPSTFEGAGNSICVSGVAGQVMDADFDTTWGAGVGLNFNDESAWNAAAVGVGGIQFSISSVPSGTVQVNFETAEGPHCSTISTSGTHIMRFEETSVACWEGAGGDTPSPSDIYRITWLVTTTEAGTRPFDFCISNVAAVP